MTADTESNGSLSSPLNWNAGVAGKKPKIKSVSRIIATQYQTIVISGSGFGTLQPYSGDSAYIKIADTTANWNAGYEGTSEYDAVGLEVTGWTDRKITIAGFTGGYGSGYWFLTEGDHIQVSVWNAKNGDGPAMKRTKVK